MTTIKRSYRISRGPQGIEGVCYLLCPTVENTVLHHSIVPFSLGRELVLHTNHIYTANPRLSERMKRISHLPIAKDEVGKLQVVLNDLLPRLQGEIESVTRVPEQEHKSWDPYKEYMINNTLIRPFLDHYWLATPEAVRRVPSGSMQLTGEQTAPLQRPSWAFPSYHAEQRSGSFDIPWNISGRTSASRGKYHPSPVKR